MFKKSYDLNKELFDISENSIYRSHEDLYAWYKFDQDVSSDGNLRDSSGNGRKLKPKGGATDRPLAPVADTPGSLGFQKFSTEFDNDLLVTDEGADIAFPNGFTFSTWVKFNTVGSVIHSLAYIGNNQFAAGDHSLNIYYQNTSIERLFVRVGDADSTAYLGRVSRLTGTPLSSGVWYHIAVTYDGTTNASGIIIYLNGVDISSGALGYDNSSGVFSTMTSPPDARYCIGNFYNESTTYDFDGLISENALWSKKFSSTEVSNLYSLASFSNALAISRRAYTGFQSKGSQVVTLESEGELNNSYGSDEEYIREGWNTVSRKNYTGIAPHIKANSDDTVLFGGKEREEIFDDTESVKIGSGSFYFGERKKTYRLNHVMERRDLGQSSLYDHSSDFVESTNPEDPIEIINIDPFELFLPIGMVDFSSEVAKDGVIEPLDIRSKIDRSSLDVPFHVRGMRGSLAEETPFRRSSLIEEGYNLNDSPVVPYLDSPEYFGPVEIAPIFHEEDFKIFPFSDTTSEAELYFSKKADQGRSISSDIVSVLIKGDSFNTSDSEKFEVNGRRGFDYLGGRTDSIAFGGMKK